MPLRRFRTRRLWPAWLPLLFAAPGAQAHGSIQGLGEFGSGLLHPATTTSHMLVLLALGLWTGQHWSKGLKVPLITFVVVSALGLVLTTGRFVSAVYQPILVGLACVAASLVALQKSLPTAAAAILFGAAALAIGLDSGLESASALAVTKSLAGTWISLQLILFDVGFYVSRAAGKKYLQIGIRVLGSWIIAISLLVLAFSLRK